MGEAKDQEDDEDIEGVDAEMPINLQHEGGGDSSGRKLPSSLRQAWFGDRDGGSRGRDDFAVEEGYNGTLSHSEFGIWCCEGDIRDRRGVIGREGKVKAQSRNHPMGPPIGWCEVENAAVLPWAQDWGDEDCQRLLYG